MSVKSTVLCFLGILGASGFALPAAGQSEGSYDDFSDGSATDGKPVRWVPHDVPLGYGTAEVRDGDLLLTPDADAPAMTPFIPEIGPNWIELDVRSEDRLYQDVSIHIQARVSGQGPGWLGIDARDTWSLVDDQAVGVWGQLIIDLDSNIKLDLGGHTGTAFMSPVQRPTSLNFHETDVHLQLDVFGNTASLFAWADGEAKPAVPQLSRRLVTSQMIEGNVAVTYGQFRPPINELNTAAFRFVEVVPEPSSAVLAALGSLGLLFCSRRVSRPACNGPGVGGVFLGNPRTVHA